MTDNKNFDVIIIGGSYAGLSAAMALGRSLRRVMVIDSGKPCNRQTPHSHNFITQDGKTPQEIAALAKEQVAKYETIEFHRGLATNGTKTENGFEITTGSGDTFASKKLIFATGVTDLLPNIKGFSDCWGISVLHCPYCHGYEVRNEKTAIIGNGEFAFEFCKMISNWTSDLRLFTNGKSTLTEDQLEKITLHNIEIIETEIDSFEHHNGRIKNIVLKGDLKVAIKAVYARPPFVQHCGIPAALGCELEEHGLLKVDPWQKTNVAGIRAAGDNSTLMRSVASSVATGSIAGAATNKELIEEQFSNVRDLASVSMQG